VKEEKSEKPPAPKAEQVEDISKSEEKYSPNSSQQYFLRDNFSYPEEASTKVCLYYVLVVESCRRRRATES
jgi:hypothetical protein